MTPVITSTKTHKCKMASAGVEAGRSIFGAEGFSDLPKRKLAIGKEPASNTGIPAILLLMPSIKLRIFGPTFHLTLLLRPWQPPER